jgi:predicted DNA-binding transcriptional regulator AlpA
LVNLDQGLGAAPTEAEVCSLSTFSEATLLREEAAGRFPKPVRIGPLRVGYPKAVGP